MESEKVREGSKADLKRKIKEEVDRRVEGKDLSPEKRLKLEKLYYDPREGYGDVRKVYENAKLGGLGVTYRQVKNWMGDQYVVQANEPTSKPKHWNTIAAAGPGFNYQMDLIDYTRYRTDGYGWILVIIDVYSRKAGARAIKAEYTRKGKRSIKAKVKWEQYLEFYKEIVEEDFDGRYPKDLNCDNEFIEENFQKFVTSKGTQIHYSDPLDFNKNAIVERFNRTIELMIQKHRFATDDIDWPTYLADLVHNYNTRWHSTIKATPNGVWNGDEKSRQKITWLWNTMAVGDQVRKKLHLNIFAKGDELRYSKDIYILIERKGNRWLLRNIRTGEKDDNKGRWYKENQLQKVNNIVNPKRKTEGIEKEAENYAIKKEKEESKDVDEVKDDGREKGKEKEREREEDEEQSDERNSSKHGVSHKNTIKQLSLNRRLKRFTKNVNEQPHEEVEEDPDRPGHVRFVIPERLVPSEAKRDRKLNKRRRLDVKTFTNQTEERRKRRKRRKGK